MKYPLYEGQEICNIVNEKQLYGIIIRESECSSKIIFCLCEGGCDDAKRLTTIYNLIPWSVKNK
jgi:hypothetical protein